MLPVPTVQDLADFSGRPAATYTSFATTALAQATLMFSVATGLEDWPEDPDLKQVALYAVLEMADKLILEQPYQLLKAAPFQTETIGSYSYGRSNSTTSKTGQGDLGTGLFWWDTALDLFQQDAVILSAHGSIAVDHEGIVNTPIGPRIENPVEQGLFDRPPYIRIS
jgi:hypothetical protein